MEICRAGFGPPPACRALPKIVSSTCWGCTPARSSAAFAATTPISAAESEASDPPNLPMGVRTAESMKTLFTKHSSVAAREKILCHGVDRAPRIKLLAFSRVALGTRGIGGSTLRTR